ncbi:L-glyceraldehyde 3-phosphate reductase [bacterium BMS3Abin03]|nr:L-glyceraldehyde 3-phosphate reductase [bacterium BMS3Abin03]MCG6961080.1 L-glyceraldehyde 3-phosphate reductase [bacterium BMS3Abin03]
MPYAPSSSRYNKINYNRCGNSGLKLPPVSLGLWHNFGGVDVFENCRNILHRAFDLGITHFDLANNYGPPYGSAEETFGKIFKKDFIPHRDELIISTKAGWDMWDGPYGDFGSRKYLIASLDQSLKRMGIEYADIFYHHRPDPETPLEETMGALDHIVKSGKALYVGISQYNAEDTKRASDILKSMGTKLLIHQPRYNMMDRWIENGLTDVLRNEGIGCIAFSPLVQGLLTNRYLDGIPSDSRAAKDGTYLSREQVTEDKINKIKKLNDLAATRNQSLAQMAIAWVLRDPVVTSALIGASKVSQVEDAVGAVKNINFSEEELKQIDDILS